MRRIRPVAPGSREFDKSRQVVVRMADFGNDELNRQVDRLMQSFANEIAQTFARERRKKPTKNGR